MTKKELHKVRSKWLHEHLKYKMCYYKKFSYEVLSNIMYSRRSGRGRNETWSDVIIMADTETSKKKAGVVGENHVVAWTISIRAFDMNFCTLYGTTPDEFTECLSMIRNNIAGDYIICFFHNLPYDYVFIRKFLYEKFGHPVKQLNIKPHYPLFISFENGLQIRDSLILAQRSLDKWAKDLGAEHQKATGCWDYEKLRNQHENFSAEELTYIEHDTLAGVECIDIMLSALKKQIWSLPYTATGIPREEVRKRGKENEAKALFDAICLDYDQYKKQEKLFHGGYTHANRHLIDTLIEGLVQCYDFTSSYPFVLLTRKYAMEKFSSLPDCNLERIVSCMEEEAYMFKLILIRPHLKNDFIPMPVLQVSKCVRCINPLTDNGRILSADYVEIYLNEIDGALILDQYNFEGNMCTEVECAHKDYLPRWFTDYIFELFTDKCHLKGKDPVLYALAKAKLNSLYGLCVQKSIKQMIDEDYQTGDFSINTDEDEHELYDKYLKNKGNILLFSWGCWCTSYAMYNLFQLGKCIKREEGETISHWIYSDTDSIYSDAWDTEKVKVYNEKCKDDLMKNGYGSVVVNGKEYWLGIAEHKELEDDYTQFKTQGAKRYCGRNKEDNLLHITVAGVPKKKGALCLDDDINNFTAGFIFPGTKTGKLTHTYFFVDHIYKDEHDNITGDSINLSPCDYLLDSTEVNTDWFHSFDEEVNFQVYEED